MSVLNITKENFAEEVLNKKGTVLVDFYADWCGPCKMLMPVVHEIAEEQQEFSVGKVNVDASMELAQQFGVVSIPTLICFKDGKPVEKKLGVQSKQTILDMCR